MPHRYSDDEDTSYKIRRSATKVLSGVISTRPELLSLIHKEVAPVLISRFGDREENVRLEVWAAYVALLNQTLLYGGIPRGKDDASSRGKRKRETDNVNAVDSAYNLLQGQVSNVSKALLNQLKSTKTSPATLQAGFGLLHTLLTVLPGSLSTQVPLVASTAKSVLSQSPTTSTSTLHLTVLSFLALFFTTHTPPTFSGSLPTLTPVLLKSVGERHPRIAAESFRVFSALLNALKPLKTGDWAERLYEQAFSRLNSHETDADVRAAAEDVTGDLWVAAPDVVRKQGGKEWELICRSTGKTDNGVRVITKVAKGVVISDEWVNTSIGWVTGLLKKSGRQGKVDIFLALIALLRA